MCNKRQNYVKYVSTHCIILQAINIKNHDLSMKSDQILVWTFYLHIYKTNIGENVWKNYQAIHKDLAKTTFLEAMLARPCPWVR